MDDNTKKIYLILEEIYSLFCDILPNKYFKSEQINNIINLLDELKSEANKNDRI